MDTRATDEKDGIIIPDINEDDSLIGELDNSLMGNSMNSKHSRVDLIRTRRQQERKLDLELSKME